MDDLELREGASLVAEADASADGTFLIHVIRPCIGRGRGNHLYESDMLARDAGVFTGWKMYVDHEDPSARGKRGGLPRSVRELGGRVVEAWWDPSVPAEGRFGQGAVVGRVKPTPFIRELVENDPDIVGVSINAMATGIKAVTRGGKRVNLVEGIAPSGSVDWVTEIGAGGRVAALREAVADEPWDGALIDAMTTEEFMSYVDERRPELAEAVKAKHSEPDADENGGPDDGDADEGKCPECGTKTPHGEKCSKCGHMVESAEEEIVKPEDIREALSDPGVRAAIEEIVEARVASEIAERLPVAAARVLFEARADFDRTLMLRDLRDYAHAAITEAGLPPAFTADALSRFALTEDGVTPGLDVMPEFAEDGSIARTEREVIEAAVAEEIERQKTLLAEANPTVVEGLGSTDDGGNDASPKKTQGRHLSALLQETRGR